MHKVLEVKRGSVNLKNITTLCHWIQDSSDGNTETVKDLMSILISCRIDFKRNGQLLKVLIKIIT